jgi:hypothetical protein
VARGRVVYVIGGLGEEGIVTLTANLAASGQPAILLFDTPGASAGNRSFLESQRPDQVVPVGSFPDGIPDLESRLGINVMPVLAWKEGPPVELWRRLFPRASRVVLCPSGDRRLLLQSACLAGALRAPFGITRGEPGERPALARCLDEWQTRTVVAIGAAADDWPESSSVRLRLLTDERAVAAACRRHLSRRGPIETLVVANPSDGARGLSPLSVLAPRVALEHRAALVLTSEKGTDVNERVRTALKEDPRLDRAETLFFLGDLKAIPMEERPNPVAGGKDAAIEMEPLTPAGAEPFSFATGRLFHEDRGVVALILARRHLLGESGGPLRALLVSNPTGNLPLLETFSRNTAKEFHNGGYQTTAFLGEKVDKDDLRRLLPEQDLVLWEGHLNTLVKEYGPHLWPEPLRPGVVFLQSCLALSEGRAQPFLERGALGVVGTSTRTYSASGGACTLAFFDGLLYDHQTLGGALRQAKNFLLAYALLKEKRLGASAKLRGANLRSAWAFTLWGDPTVRLPQPEAPTDALPPIRHRVHGNTITLFLPDTAYEKASTSKYRAQIVPNARLAGLLRRESEDGAHPLVPLLFAEVRLPHAPAGRMPVLHSSIPASHWVFCWDARRGAGYLLVAPRARDQKELRFRVRWQSPEEGAVAREPGSESKRGNALGSSLGACFPDR